MRIFRQFARILTSVRPVVNRPFKPKMGRLLGMVGLLAGTALHFSRKNGLIYAEEERKSVDVLYDPNNKLQEKDAKAQAEMLRAAFKDMKIDVNMIPLEGVDNKDNARVQLRTGIGNIKIPRRRLSKAVPFVTQKTTIKKAENLFDVAEYLKETNQELFDSTIICYYSDKDWDKFISDPANNNAVKSLFQSNNGFIRIASKKLAKKMKLQKRIFYKYYKPSFINGHANVYNFNVEYLQAIEGGCRNPLKLINGTFTEDEKVEFHFHKSYKKLLAQPRNNRPIVYIYWDKNAIIWPFMDQITKLARKYDSDCDFVFSSDKRKSSKYFHMGEVEESVPHIFIVDTDKRIPIKSPFSGEQIGTYPVVYSEVALLMFGVEEGSKFLDKFFQGKLVHIPQSKRMYKPTLVKTLNKESFETEVLNNDQVQQCVIQVYKHNCASCFYNSKSFDALSWKLQKYGLWDKLKLYKLRNDNDIPQLGTFPYTPMYIFIKKGTTDEDKGHIVEIATLESPQKFDLFKGQLEKASGLDLSKIKLDPKAQFEKYIKKEDKEEGFDFDFDAAPTVKKEDKAENMQEVNKDKPQ